MTTLALARSTGRNLPETQGEVAPSTKRGRLPPLMFITLLALLVPAYFSIGPLALTPSKVLFLITTPILTINLLRGRYGGFIWVDGLIIAHLVWMTLAMMANHPLSRAIEYMGSNTLIIFGGYLTGRATIRSRDDFVGLIRFLALVVVFSLPFAIYESWTSRTTIPRWLAELPGITSHSDVQHPPRLGLYRTQFVFAHPIHYGLFCALCFSQVYVGLAGIWGRFRRLIVSAIIMLCCVFSGSSGPILALAVAIGLVLWSVTMNWTGMRWKILAWLSIIGYAIIEAASTRFAIYAIVERLSLDPQTAFFRRLQFEFGVAQIKRTPILGVGFNRYPLPFWFNTTSIDNFWLQLAVQFGMPTFLLCAAAFIVAMVSVGRNDFSARPDLLPLRLGWMFSAVAIVLTLATVALWGEMDSIIFLFLGSGIWMSQMVTPVAGISADEPTESPAQAGPRYTRFDRVTPGRDASSVEHRRRRTRGQNLVPLSQDRPK
jgi:O-antigen ligase